MSAIQNASPLNLLGVADGTVAVGDLFFISDSTVNPPKMKKITAYIEGIHYTTAITGLDSRTSDRKILIPTSSGNWCLIQYTATSTTVDVFWIVTSGTTVSSVTRTTLTVGSTIATNNYMIAAYWDNINSRIILTYIANTGTNLICKGCAISINGSNVAAIVNEITIKDMGVVGTAGTNGYNKLFVMNSNLFCVCSGSGLTTNYCTFLSIVTGSLNAGTTKDLTTANNSGVNGDTSIVGGLYNNSKYWLLFAAKGSNNIVTVGFTGTSTISLDSVYVNININNYFSIQYGTFVNYNNQLYLYATIGTASYVNMACRFFDNGSGLEIEYLTPLSGGLTSQAAIYPNSLTTLDTVRGQLIYNNNNSNNVYVGFSSISIGKGKVLQRTQNAATTAYLAALFAYHSISDYVLAFYSASATVSRLIVLQPSNINQLAGIITQAATNTNPTQGELVGGICSNATGITSTSTTDGIFFDENNNTYGSLSVGVQIGKRLSITKAILQNPYN